MNPERALENPNSDGLHSTRQILSANTALCYVLQAPCTREPSAGSERATGTLCRACFPSTHQTFPADPPLRSVLHVPFTSAITTNPEREIETQSVSKRAPRNRVAPADPVRSTRDTSAPAVNLPRATEAPMSVTQGGQTSLQGWVSRLRQVVPTACEGGDTPYKAPAAQETAWTIDKHPRRQ